MTFRSQSDYGRSTDENKSRHSIRYHRKCAASEWRCRQSARWTNTLEIRPTVEFGRQYNEGGCWLSQINFRSSVREFGHDHCSHWTGRDGRSIATKCRRAFASGNSCHGFRLCHRPLDKLGEKCLAIESCRRKTSYQYRCLQYLNKIAQTVGAEY